MTRKRWQLTRREMIRGAGVAMSLPMLEAMTPTKALAASAWTKAPVRTGVLFMPNGVWPQTWFPDASLSSMPFAMEPLAPMSKKMLVLSDMCHANSLPGDGHHANTGNFLTGAPIKRTEGADIQIGVSMDQVAAQHLASTTRLPSMELGVAGQMGGGTMGYSRIYGSYISWRSPTQPMEKETNPQAAFDRLFRFMPKGSSTGAGAENPAPAAPVQRDDRSLLDLVLEDAKSMRARLGTQDQRKIDEYLDAVRSVERQMDQLAKLNDDDAQPGQEQWRPTFNRGRDAKRPPIHGSHAEHVRLMIDIMVLGFWSDTTRVSSFMMGNGISLINYSFVDGVDGALHEISHHKGDAGKIEQYKRTNRWHVEQLAYMMQRMDAIQEGGGRTLLDNSMLLFGSEILDGNRHDKRSLPIILAGSGGGVIKGGRHLRCGGNPLCNLYLAMLQRMGVPANQFGDSTGPLAGLTG